MLKGQFTKNGSFSHILAIFWPIWPKHFSTPKTTIWTLFRPRKQLFTIFRPFFDQFSQKYFGPKTTIWTLFRPRKQLFTIFWPFFDQFGQKKFLGQKPLFGPFLGPENNFLPYFGHFLTNLAENFFWAKNHYLDPF